MNCHISCGLIVSHSWLLIVIFLVIGKHLQDVDFALELRVQALNFSHVVGELTDTSLANGQHYFN